jgi:catalase-peroxidase
MKIKHTFLASALAVALTAALPVNPVLAEMQPTTNSFWWPEQLDLKPLRQNAAESNPLGKAFNYAEQFKTGPESS